MTSQDIPRAIYIPKNNPSLVGRNLLLRQSRGPNTVYQSVISALKDTQIEYKLISESKLKEKAREGSTVFIPQWSGKIEDLFKLLQVSHLNVTLGPNIDLKLRELSNFLTQNSLSYKNFLVPSSWVKNIYQNVPLTKEIRLRVWPAGVNTEYWKPKTIHNRKRLLIYIKGETNFYVNGVLKLLTELYGSRLIIVEYGKYSTRQYKSFLEDSFAAIWLAGTESQGMALAEAWAMDVPTLVRESNERNIFGKSWIASAAPYLSDSTGSFFNENEDFLAQYDLFLENISGFKPRDWVILNQSYSTQILSLRQILEEK